MKFEKKIPAETVESMLRVAIANAMARTTVVTIDAMHEIGESLSHAQRIELVSRALMEYRTAADESEHIVAAELAILEVQGVLARVNRATEWATAEEARQRFIDETEI